MTIKTLPHITSEINTLLGDNTAGDITPADLRQVVQDMVDSYSSLWPSSLDYASGTAAISAVSGNGGGVLVVPGGAAEPTLPASFTDVLVEYLGPLAVFDVYADGDAAANAKRLFRSQHAGSHSDGLATVGIECRPVGSGTAGPAAADVALLISHQKKDWFTTTTIGELDGIVIAIRQGGSDAGGSDAAGILVNAINAGTSGFIAAMEALVQTTGRSPAVTIASVDCKVGAIVDGSITSFQAQILVGTSAIGFECHVESGADVSSAFRYSTAAGVKWQIDTSGFMLVEATQVVSTRKTGWNAPTGSLSRGTFDAGANLATTAQTLAALITDLRDHGLIGT